MEEKRKAVKTDWETRKMPKKHTEYTIKKHFSPEQIEILRFGHIPEVMEDKWFWYMEDDTLYIHRSWTGNCIYVLSFEAGNTIHVTANRDPQQYTCTDEQEDAAYLCALLDRWT